MRDYLYHLDVGLGSLGESLSAFLACHRAQRINQSDFEALKNLAFKLENGLPELVAGLERKQDTGDWLEHLVVKESNVAYGVGESGAMGTTRMDSLNGSGSLQPTPPPLHNSHPPYATP